MLLLSEVAAFSQTGLTTSWSAEDHVASGANSSDLGVREDGLKKSLMSIFEKLRSHRNSKLFDDIPWFYSIQGILRPWNRSLEIELTASSCGIFVDHPTWDLGGQLSKAFRKSDRVKSEKIWLRSRFLFWIWISRLGWIHLPWINRATFAWNNEINSIELVYYTRTRIFDPDISR